MCRQKRNQRASKALPAQSRTLRGGHFIEVLFHRCRLGLSQAMKDFFVVFPINLCRRTGVFSHFQVGYKWLERSSISPWILTGSSKFWPEWDPSDNSDPLQYFVVSIAVESPHFSWVGKGEGGREKMLQKLWTLEKGSSCSHAEGPRSLVSKGNRSASWRACRTVPEQAVFRALP